MTDDIREQIERLRSNPNYTHWLSIQDAADTMEKMLAELEDKDRALTVAIRVSKKMNAVVEAARELCPKGGYLSNDIFWKRESKLREALAELDKDNG